MQPKGCIEMNKDRFIALTKLGEGNQIEYKTCREDVSESLYETVCSFLNHTGGHILMGVTDDGMIVGVNSDRAETLKKNIINSIKNTELFLPCPYFTPQILGVDDKVVLYLEIPCGEYVYRFKGRYWDRNGDADIDVTDQPELLLSLFERKNPHLFEERTVEGLTMEHLDHATFQYSRNVIAARKPAHPWLQMTDEQILLSTHLAKRSDDDKLLLKYAALILFGKEDAIVELMPRYRFEALFHMCTYAQYNDMKQFPNRYDDRRTMRRTSSWCINSWLSLLSGICPTGFICPRVARSVKTSAGTCSVRLSGTCAYIPISVRDMPASSMCSKTES